MTPINMLLFILLNLLLSVGRMALLSLHGSGLLRIHDQQHDATGQRECADDRRDKVVVCGLEVHSEEIDGFSRSRESDARVGEHHDAQCDQYDCYNFCIHLEPLVFFLRFSNSYTALRPEMMLINTMTMATTSRMWMNPPMVVLVTKPSTHRTKSTTAIVHNIVCSFRIVLARCRLAHHAPTGSVPIV